MIATDKFGRIFKLGDKVLKAYSKHIFVCRVTKIIGDKIYLDNVTSQYLRYPNRCVIIPNDFDVD